MPTHSSIISFLQRGLRLLILCGAMFLVVVYAAITESTSDHRLGEDSFFHLTLVAVVRSASEVLYFSDFDSTYAGLLKTYKELFQLVCACVFRVRVVISNTQTRNHSHKLKFRSRHRHALTHTHTHTQHTAHSVPHTLQTVWHTVCGMLCVCVCAHTGRVGDIYIGDQDA
jgi:hypothetical protein